ncbi:hypothetical protein GCM10029976_014180 [Kribbella albertanoniae]
MRIPGSRVITSISDSTHHNGCGPIGTSTIQAGSYLELRGYRSLVSAFRRSRSLENAFWRSLSGVGGIPQKMAGPRYPPQRNSSREASPRNDSKLVTPTGVPRQLSEDCAGRAIPRG